MNSGRVYVSSEIYGVPGNLRVHETPKLLHKSLISKIQFPGEFSLKIKLAF